MLRFVDPRDVFNHCHQIKMYNIHRAVPIFVVATHVASIVATMTLSDVPLVLDLSQTTCITVGRMPAPTMQGMGFADSALLPSFTLLRVAGTLAYCFRNETTV